MKLKFSRQFKKKITPISNFTKILPVWAELFHADGQTDRRTDMTKLMSDFRNFANTPKNRIVISVESTWKLKMS